MFHKKIFHHFFKRSFRGQSLVEGLVALSMASIVIVAIVAVVSSSLSTSRLSATREKASQLSQDAMEIIRSQRGLTEGFYCLGIDGELGLPAPVDTCTEPNINQEYIRKVEVVIDGCATGVDNVIVSTSWQETSCENGEFCQSVQLATCLDPSGLIGGNYPVPPTATPSISPTPENFTPTPTPVPPTLTFTASPLTVPYNGSAVLSWTSNYANSCTASGSWSGSKPISGSQSTGQLTTSRTYTLVCGGVGGTVSRSVTVSVNNPPTPTPTSSPTPTATPTPVYVTENIITNSGFESGSTGWQYSSGNGYNVFCVNGGDCSPWTAGTGSRWVYLGGYPNANDQVYKQITIPSTATRADLRFLYRIGTAETTTSVVYDRLYVTVRDPSNTLLQHLITLSNLDKTGSSGNTVWVSSSTYDLLAYKGQTIRIRFLATTNNDLWTAFHLDDVVLDVRYIP